MMDDLTKFAELLRAQTGADLEETKDSTDLELSREEFMHKMMREPDGQALLDLLETGEWKIVERLGLCTATMEEKGPVFRVPRWKNLVAHLRIVNSV